MKLDIVEKFIQELAHPSHRLTLDKFFCDLKYNSLYTFNVALNELPQLLRDENRDISATFLQGILTGIALQFCAEHSPLLSKTLEDYITQCQRLRGENIIDFISKRSEKR